MPHKSFCVHLSGSWPRSRVQIAYQPTEYILPGEFSRCAVEFWEQRLAGGQQHLFNDALCRLDNFHEHDGVLQLSLSRTCYRDLLFSNAHTGELVAKLGETGPVRALGISAIIETADGYLPFIRRSEHVGEAPGGLDVIGGHVHPDEHAPHGAPDVFFAMQDELQAEAGLPADLLGDFICCGLAENRLHRKPELAFFVPLPLTLPELRRLAQNAREGDEYTELLAVRADKADLQKFILEHYSSITPAKHGCLQLYMRLQGW
ncbi:MAG: hypothetical protein ONB43_06175 [candidate division KSB1 bacterium]|nr:hypothetical protein [candidate division KSB1 bacterium]MDZ7403508.1 hypothetical protein [candidate division KSB1 bacterium]